MLRKSIHEKLRMTLSFKITSSFPPTLTGRRNHSPSGTSLKTSSSDPPSLVSKVPDIHKLELPAGPVKECLNYDNRFLNNFILLRSSKSIQKPDIIRGRIEILFRNESENKG